MVTGTFNSAAKGILYEPSLKFDDKGNAVISFVAESDSAGATSPCFDAWLPVVSGYPVRMSCQSVSGYAPTATTTWTLQDEFDSTWTYSVTTSGSADMGSGKDVPWVQGKLRLYADTFGAASKRWKVAIFVRPEPLVVIA